MKKLLSIILILFCCKSSGYSQTIPSYQRVSFSELMKMAEQNRPELKASKLKVEIAQQGLKKAIEQKLPSLQVNADNRYNTQLQTNLLPGLIFGQTGQDRLVAFGAAFSHIVSLEAGINVFRPEQKSELQQKRILLEKEENAVKELLNQVRAEVAEAALNQFITIEQFRLRSLNREQLVIELKEAEEEYKEGKRLKVEVNRAKLALLQQENQIKESARQLKISSRKLIQVLGFDEENQEFALSEASIGNIPQLTTTNMNANFDLQKMRLSLLEQQQKIRFQKSQFLPQVSAYGLLANQYLSQDFDVFQFSKPWMPFSYVGLKLNWKLFDKQSRMRSLKQERIQLQVLELDQQRLNQQLKTEKVVADEELYSYQEAVILAEEQYQLTNSIFETDKSRNKEGKLLGSELEESKLSVDKAYFEVQKAKVDYWKAWFRLKRLEGSIPLN